MHRVFELNFGRNFAVALVAFALVSATLIGVHVDSSVLHTILDTSAVVMSVVLALVLWDIGARTGETLPRLLAVVFVAVTVFALLHTIAALEAVSGLVIGGLQETRWRVGTWGLTTHLLPLAIIALELWPKQFERRRGQFLTALLVLGVVLLAGLDWLPPSTGRYWLGIARPTLVLGPFLWAAAGYLCWRQRDGSDILRALALTAAIMALGNIAIVYSSGPNDAAAMVTHFGNFIGYLFLLVSVMEMGAIEMARCAEAEDALQRLNAELEWRVRERTAEFELSNEALKAEATLREQAENKLKTQFDRLSLVDRITRSVAARQDMPSIFQVVIRSLEDQLPVDFACIGRYDSDEHVVTIGNLGLKSRPIAVAIGMPEESRIAVDENGLLRSVKGELVYEPDIARVSFAFSARLAAGGLRALVIAPLIVEGKVHGVLVVARRAANSFTSTDCEFLKQLCEHVSLAVHQAQLRDKLQEAYDDLRQTRQAVMQQERLRALGQMASGIAHDINNAISPMALHTQSLLETGGNFTPRVRSYLEIVRRVTDDVTATVARMREFYREHDPGMTLSPINLNQLAEQVIDLTQARWADMPQRAGVTVEMRTDFAVGLPAAKGIESEVREALTNLIFNAVDAMPQGGRLTVRTGIANGGAAPRVQIEVVDTGIGMDDNTRRHCLEPFFTTKGERGTGLGLAMVYGVAQRLGAEIEIDSELGHGTTLRLIFAMAETDGAAPARLAPAPLTVPPLRILIIDDDPVILDSMRMVLELDGHEVTAANDGRSGVESFRAAHGTATPFAVVITDLGMPYMDGHEVARAVKEISVTTSVILLTGWGRRMTGDRELPAYIDRTLDKPPKLAELREALANTLAMAEQ